MQRLGAAPASLNARGACRYGNNAVAMETTAAPASLSARGACRYGNNAVEMETTAVWDAASATFTINTPSTLAQKYWITNSAVHAKWCVVFAQLLMAGKQEGIHAFLVRIRDEQMRPMAGVRIEDMGHKMGCNGVLFAFLPQDGLRECAVCLVCHNMACNGVPFCLSTTNQAEMVRIRDDEMRPMAGVRIEDMGHKMGCNGVLCNKFGCNRVPFCLSTTRWAAMVCFLPVCRTLGCNGVPSVPSACPQHGYHEEL